VAMNNFNFYTSDLPMLTSRVNSISAYLEKHSISSKYFLEYIKDLYDFFISNVGQRMIPDVMATIPEGNVLHGEMVMSSVTFLNILAFKGVGSFLASQASGMLTAYPASLPVTYLVIQRHHRINLMKYRDVMDRLNNVLLLFLRSFGELSLKLECDSISNVFSGRLPK
jgi:hypothetical protein